MREAARMARVEKPLARPAGSRESGSLTAGCYTGLAGRGRCPPQTARWSGIATPVTRSLPARFETYIALSALIISSSTLRPSSG